MPDIVLIALLVGLVPAYQLWRSLRRRGAPKPAKLRGYLRTVAMALMLLVPVLAVWSYQGRSWAALGLGLPLPGLVGLGVAVVGLGAMAPGMRRPMKAADRRGKAALELLPTTRAEVAAFVATMILIGFAWELLYRGYLMWALTPYVGTAGAVLIAAFAYGLAHGFKDARQLIGSLVSALIFTLAYVLTHSLWWLMVVHAGLPLLMLLASAANRPPPEAELTPA
jgi:membrane protease YdiL (CAAX protease family)